MALLNSFSSGVSAVKTFGKSLEVIGDNIANVNTTGFKGSRITNQDNYSQTFQVGTAANGTSGGTNSIQVGSGTSVASISQQFTQGVLNTTGGPSDLGIAGKGFFKVLNPTTSEYYYTRAGDFHMDNDGNLLTNQGYNVLMDGTTNINIPPTVDSNNLASYSIDESGFIKAYYEGANTPTTVGQIFLTNFTNPNALERVGENLLTNPGTNGADGGPAGAVAATTTATQPGQIKQGTLELSNVDLTQQFSDMIVAQRSFQAGSRVITVSDTVMEEIVNLKR